MVQSCFRKVPLIWFVAMSNFRVCLTYRVKSAHKLKLTDKQLLHWLCPLLAVMVVYLRYYLMMATTYFYLYH